MAVDWCKLPLWMTSRAYDGALSTQAGPGRRATPGLRAPVSAPRKQKAHIKPGPSLSSSEKDPMRRRTAKLR